MTETITELQERKTFIGQADTNTEYIQPEVAERQPAVLKSVARSIVIETLKDLFSSIIGFFLRYIKHFINCFRYFWSPTLRKKPFDQMDFKENSQHAFEFTMLILLFLIFMVKVEWIPPSAENLLEVYNNDIVEKFMEIFLFLIFATTFLVVAGLSIVSGRFFKWLFKIDITKRESDILFVYMNNAYFSFTAVIALFIRSVASNETHDINSVTEVLLMIILPVVFITLPVWSIRFARLHNMKFLKGSLFFLFSIILFGLFYSISSLFISAIVLGL